MDYRFLTSSAKLVVILVFIFILVIDLGFHVEERVGGSLLLLVSSLHHL